MTLLCTMYMKLYDSSRSYDTDAETSKTHCFSSRHKTKPPDHCVCLDVKPLTQWSVQWESLSSTLRLQRWSPKWRQLRYLTQPVKIQHSVCGMGQSQHARVAPLVFYFPLVVADLIKALIGGSNKRESHPLSVEAKQMKSSGIWAEM